MHGTAWPWPCVLASFPFSVTAYIICHRRSWSGNGVMQIILTMKRVGCQSWRGSINLHIESVPGDFFTAVLMLTRLGYYPSSTLTFCTIFCVSRFSVTLTWERENTWWYCWYCPSCPFTTSYHLWQKGVKKVNSLTWLVCILNFFIISSTFRWCFLIFILYWKFITLVYKATI